MRFSCTKCCATVEALALDVEDRDAGTRTSVERHLGMVGRHVERPPHELDLEARRVGRHEEAVMPLRIARLARGAREDEVVGGVVQAGVEALDAVDDPVVAVAARGGLQPGGVASRGRAR